MTQPFHRTPTTATLMPSRTYCFVVQGLHDMIMAFTHLDRPSSTSFFDFCYGLDILNNLDEQEIDLLQRMGKVRKYSLVTLVFCWVRLRAISTAADQTFDQLAAANRDARKTQKQLLKGIEQLRKSSEVMDSAPGVWPQVGRHNSRLADSLNELQSQLVTRATTRRWRQQLYSAYAHWILLGAVVVVRGFLETAESGQGLRDRLLRRVMGPPAEVPNVTIWRIINAAECSVGLHSTAAATLQQRYARKSGRRPSTYIDEHFRGKTFSR